MQWCLELADLPTWTANDRGHWSQRAGAVAAWRMVAKQAANRAGIPPQDRLHVRLTMVPADRRRRDPDNLSGALKPILDGLVDANVLPDDSAKHVCSVMLVIDAPDVSRRGHRWLVTLFTTDEVVRLPVDGDGRAS